MIEAIAVFLSEEKIEPPRWLVSYFRRVAELSGREAAFKAVMKRSEGWSDDPAMMAQATMASADARA